ncbi:MAG: hypothetical protein K2N03_08375 [Muribaculaceae bacterium]|nr:hypothetical protein [Muribaculaceae bacterium]
MQTKLLAQNNLTPQFLDIRISLNSIKRLLQTESLYIAETFSPDAEIFNILAINEKDSVWIENHLRFILSDLTGNLPDTILTFCLTSVNMTLQFKTIRLMPECLSLLLRNHITNYAVNSLLLEWLRLRNKGEDPGFSSILSYLDSRKASILESLKTNLHPSVASPRRISPI